jgi:hypothetical protein
MKQIAQLLSRHTKNKEAKIEEAMIKIKAYLKKRNISAFSRSFLNNMLFQYMEASDRTKKRMVTAIIEKLPSHNSVVTKRYLGLDKNHIDRIWRTKGRVETFYYFE